MGAGHAGFGDGFDFGDLGAGEGEVVAGVDGVAGDADGGHDDDEVAQGFAVGVAEGCPYFGGAGDVGEDAELFDGLV